MILGLGWHSCRMLTLIPGIFPAGVAPQHIKAERGQEPDDDLFKRHLITSSSKHIEEVIVP
jgi:hypothetical protein